MSSNHLNGIFETNIIEDNENYYVFRALNNADHRDIANNITTDENGIARIRTDRERFEEEKGLAKYNAQSKISLEEVYDHIKIRYLKETNCISLSSNANVSIDYGQGYNQEYVMVKVPKAEAGQVYNAGQYMLEELNKKIAEAIERIPQDSEVLNVLKRIDSEESYKDVKAVVSDAYDGIKRTENKYSGRSNSIKYKTSVISRFDKKQYFSDEQQLEYNKIIAKLTVLEASGYLKSIIPTQLDNSSLIATIGMAFSSGEIIHYKDIEKDKITQVSSEIMDMISLTQQLKEKDVNKDSIKDLERNLIELIKNGYKLERENGQLFLRNQSESIKIKDLEQNDIQQETEKELSVEDVYEKTKGRISYTKAKTAIEFANKLSKSRLKTIEYANVIRALSDNNIEPADAIEKECYVVDKDIITRENNYGIKISESVNIGLDREKRRFVSNNEQLKMTTAIQELDSDTLRTIVNSNGLELESKILDDLLEKEEEISENEYFAEVIVDGIDFGKIYQTITAEKRVMTEDEKEILISKLKSADCKKLYNAFKDIGANGNEISGFITNLLLNNGYKGYSLEELSRLDNLNEIVKINTRNNNIRNGVSAVKLDSLLGIKDDSYQVEDTEIKLRDYQYETLQNIERIFEDKRFAAMILPTGAGKSFVAMSEIMKFKNVDSNNRGANSNILFVAPQQAILHQFEIHILKNVLKKKIITENEIKKLKAEGKSIPTNVIQPKDFKKVIGEEIPSLKMFCYKTLEQSNQEWLQARDADLIIFDELHRAGAKKWEPQIKKLIDLNPKAKILGMTATPVRDVDSKDMARGIAEMTGDYTTEELINKEYLASEMHLLDAMQDNYVVSPKIVTFDYTLKDSDEYKEITKMIAEEKNLEKHKELIDIKKNMDAIIRNSEKDGMQGVLAQNIKKNNGKYIVFLPKNPDSNNMKPEEYMKAEIEKVKEYFREVNPNIKTSYLLSERKNADRENERALSEFENDDSDKLKLLFAVNMLNEGVHVDGIDGAVMMRPISENSKIIYLQQIGRCIFSEDPENPTPDDKKPVIFDVYNNYLAQNMDREANKTNSTSDLQKLKMVMIWIEKHKGYIPDINSEDIKEAKKAITLKNVQRKYKKYIDGIQNKNLSESEIHEINEIVDIGKSMGLWELEIPDRIIPPGERDISRNDTFKVTGTQREFIDLFQKARQITKDIVPSEDRRLKDIISVLDIFTEYGIEISNDTINRTLKLKEVIMPNEVKQLVMDEIQELGIDREFEIGQEYNFAKYKFQSSGDRVKMFKEMDFDTLKKYGMFENFEGVTNTRPLVGKDGFIVRGRFRELNIKTGTICDENGFDRKRYYCERQKDGTYERKWARPNFDGKGNFWSTDKDGNHVNTENKYDEYKLSAQGFDKEGYPCETRYVYWDYRYGDCYPERRIPGGIPYCDNDGVYWKIDKKGEWVCTGKIYSDYGLNEFGLDKDGYYCDVQEDGSLKRKWKKPGFDAQGRFLRKDEKGEYHKGYSDYNEEGYDKNGIDRDKFDTERYYCEIQEDGTYKRKWPLPNFDKNGDFWEKDKEGNYVNTQRKFNNEKVSCQGKEQCFFDEDRFWCEYQEDGTYKRKWLMPNFDENGNFYEIDKNGEYKKTRQRYNREGFNALGLDKENYDTEGYYCEEQENGTYKRKWDMPNIDENEFIRGTNLNRYSFDREGYYYQRQEDGTYQNTGLKVNLYGFKADKKNIITKTAVDLRHFDISGKCKSNDDSIYDENGFKQDGTYLETGEKYHNGYNAYGVNEEGKTIKGFIHPDIEFTRGYIKAVIDGNRGEYIQKKYMFDNNKDNEKYMEHKISMRVYKAQEMLPELKKVISDQVREMKEKIEEANKRIKETDASKQIGKMKIKSLEKIIVACKEKIALLAPVEGIEK